MLNLTQESATVIVRLCATEGQVLSGAQLRLLSGGRSARFPEEFEWDQLIGRLDKE